MRLEDGGLRGDWAPRQGFNPLRPNSVEALWSDGDTLWAVLNQDPWYSWYGSDPYQPGWVDLYAADMATVRDDIASGRSSELRFSLVRARFGGMRRRVNAHPAGIWSDGVDVWVSDREDAKIYRYALQRRSGDATLTLLRLEGVDIGGYSPRRTSYRGTATPGLAQTTVVAFPASGATVAIEPPDADAETAGHQVALATAETTVEVSVTAADGTKRAYTAAVVREDVVSATVAAVDASVAEGDPATFEVTLSTAPAAPTTVAVSVAAEGAELSGDAPQSAAFAAGETVARLSVATADDAVVSGDGTVTVAVVAGDGYAPGDPPAATVAVVEDDTAVFAVAAAPSGIEEGAASTVTVSITSGVTFAETQDIGLSVTGDVAATDYALNPETLSLAAGAGSARATFTALDDGVAEGAEAAVVTASLGGAEIGSATVTVAASSGLSSDASLASLSLSGVEIAFDPDTTAYSAAVPHDVARTTVTALATDATAAVAVLPTDADAEAAGHQVALAVGATAISATVTAAEATRRTYTVTVTRAAVPRATLAAVTATVDEGAPAVFEAALSAAQSGPLTVSVGVTAEGVEFSGTAPASVTIAAGAKTARLTATTSDDAVVSGDGTVTARLAAGDGYVLGGSAVATVAVTEDDAAEFAVAAVPTAIEEGSASTLTVAIGNGVTFAREQEIALAVSGDVGPSDYTLVPSSLTLATGASSVSATFTASEDGATEAVEAATVTARLNGAQIGSATLTVSDPAPTPDVQIEGVAQVGRTLRAVTMEAAGGSGFASVTSAEPTLDFQWLRAGSEIVGATDETYALTPADVGAAVSVRASRGGRSQASAATVPVWGLPGNAAAGPNEEVLWATTMTVGSSDAFPVWVAGHARFAQASFGSLDDAAFALDGTTYEVTLAMLNGVGTLAFATAPALPSADGLALHWDGHRIGNLVAGTAYGEPLWSAPTPQPRADYDRYWHGASDGVRVAVSLRREHPPAAATLAAVEDAVEEGGTAAFEVSVDRAPHATLAVAVSVSAQGAALSEAAPESVTFAAGATTAALSLATADDAVVSGDGTVTARLLAGDGYALGDPSEATVAVTEDDAAEFSVAASPSALVEGDTATLTVSIANGVTYADARDVALSVTGDVAVSDFALSTDTPELPAGSSSTRATFAAVADDTEEGPETATVAATVDGAAVGAATLSIRDASADATLADLTLTDVDIGAFDPETTAYAGESAVGVGSTTVAATPADAGAAVEIADAAGSTLGTERTSALSTGANEIAATVTAEDGRTERTYAVTVTRPPPWGARLPDRDIELGGSGTATGVWSDGTTLWVVPSWYAVSLWAFDLATGARLEERDIALPEERTYTALAGRGTTLWAAVYGEARAEAYRLPGGARLADGDLAEHLSSAGNDNPTGLWADAAALRVADMTDKRVYAYALPDGARSATSEFGLAAPDTQTIFPWGLWSDGETALTSWWGRGAVRAYRLSDGARQPAFDVDTGASGNADPHGLWSNGDTLWVVDGTDRRLYAYAATGLRRPGGSGLSISSRALPVPSASPGPAVSIPDPALRARIASALGRPADAAVGANELLALTSLDLRAAGVADLTGLPHAANLTALDLSGNAVGDLRALASLPRLATLHADATGADPWQLAGLAGLRTLSLRDNGIEDLQALSGLAGLEVLDIGGNRVANLAPLATLRALRVLRADANAIRSVEPLAGLDALETLDLRGNRIPDAGPLDALRALRDVDLGGNPAASAPGDR